MIRSRAAGLPALLASACLACGRTPSPPLAQRFVDLYEPGLVDGRVAPEAPPPRVEWRFDGPAPKEEKEAGTRGWRALNGIEGLAVRDGRLVGRTTSDLPILNLALDPALEDPDTLHEVEVRLNVSAGANAMLDFSREKAPEDKRVVESARDFPWPFTSPVVAGEETRTYLLRTPFSVPLAGAHHVHLRPTDQPGATFAIESVRLVSRREHLAGVPSGVGWQGLSEIYRETIVSRAPEKVLLELRLPPRPWLDLAVGTLEDGPVTFRVAVAASARAQDETVVLERTVTRPHRWEDVGSGPRRLRGTEGNADPLAGCREAGRSGFWGAPAVRSRGARPRAAAAELEGLAAPGRDRHLGRHAASRPPGRLRLQTRHLALHRPSGPRGRALQGRGEPGLVDEGLDALALDLALPHLRTASRTSRTACPARARRSPRSTGEAGYATVCLSSVLFIGKLTNLHQGFEELHERRLATRTRVEQDGAGVRGSTRGLARDAPRRALLRLPPRHRSPRSLQAQPALRHALRRRQPRRAARAPGEGGAEVHRRSPPQALRDAEPRRAREGRPRRRRLRRPRPRLVRRLHPRHGRGDRTALRAPAHSRPRRQDPGGLHLRPRRGVPGARAHVPRPERLRPPEQRAADPVGARDPERPRGRGYRADHRRDADPARGERPAPSRARRRAAASSPS